jgi:hypothetical protein
MAFLSSSSSYLFLTAEYFSMLAIEATFYKDLFSPISGSYWPSDDFGMTGSDGLL